MNKEILKSVLADNQVEIPRHDVIPRKFEFEEFGNYVFVGIRRAGKSYLLYQRTQQLLFSGTGWDEILYINFEDERLGTTLIFYWKCTWRCMANVPYCSLTKSRTLKAGTSSPVGWQTPNTMSTQPEAMPGCLVTRSARHLADVTLK